LHSLEQHLANVAHDLRTPLASLQAQVEEVLDEARAPELEERLQAALRDCVYLAGLTENLRLASQLEEGWDPARGVETDLAATVTRVVDRLGHYARRRAIGIEHAVPEVPVVLDRVAGGSFVLTIVDDGDGVALPALARLGERTFRTDEARARDPRGSGLGLAIAKTICDRCGWSIGFARAEEGGLRVEVRGKEHHEI
jgi:signal transduction histidine kinase